MPLTLEPPTEECRLRTDECRPGAPVPLGDILPEVLAELLANPRPGGAEVFRVPPQGRAARALRLVG